MICNIHFFGDMILFLVSIYGMGCCSSRVHPEIVKPVHKSFIDSMKYITNSMEYRLRLADLNTQYHTPIRNPKKATFRVRRGSFVPVGMSEKAYRLSRFQKILPKSGHASNTSSSP
jgi:hypothetical protein